MQPILFRIGDVGIPAFFFMIMVGALVGTEIARRAARNEGLSEIVILDMAIIAIIASVIGARLFHVAFEDTAIVTGDAHYYLHNPIRILYFWQGGFVSLGAFIGTIISWIAYLYIRKQPLLRYFDVMAFATPVVIFFVRIGCVLAGCCYGKPTDFFIHLVFRHPGSTAYEYFPNTPVHATQCYAMANAVVMFVLLYFVRRHRRFYGQVLSVFLMAYGLLRFFIEEPLRGDVDRGVYLDGLLSTGQIVMAGFFAGGLMIYLFARKRYPVIKA